MSAPRPCGVRAALVAAAVAAAWSVLSPASCLAAEDRPPLRVYLAMDDHTDYVWAASAATYDEAFADMLDYYLDLADATEDAPPAHQSRFHADGSFWLWKYREKRGAAAFARLIERVRSGHISFPLNPLPLVYGGTPAEAVLRGMYYAGALERRHDLDLRLAYAQENQTLPLGVASLWAGSGAPYSFKGVCNCDTRVGGLSDRAHEIYWHEGLDGSRVLMKWYSITDDPVFGPNFHRGPGGYSEAYYPAAVVDYVTSDARFRARHPYDVVGLFGYGWDDVETYSDELVEVAPRLSNAERLVVVSNVTDFFEDFESVYRDDLPTQSVTFGNEWELGAVAQTNVFARYRRSVEKLRAAEAMATLVALEDETFLVGREAARDRAWIDFGLAWDHCIGTLGTTPALREQRVAWQRTLAAEIDAYVDALHEDARVALGALIRRAGGEPRFFAFNPLGWERDDVVDLPYDGAPDVHVVDLATGEEAPSQLVTRDGATALRVLATAVPAVGYKVFAVRPGAGGDLGAGAPRVAGSTLTNDIYTIELAGRGAVTSWVDHARGERELVRAVAGATCNDLGPGAGEVTAEEVGPVSATLTATAAGPLRHTTRVTLYRDLDRVAIENRIEENFGTTELWSFGLALDAPRTRHEEVGAIIRAALVGDGGHYARQNARYDYQTLNHFVTMTGADGVGVTLSNRDCHFFRLGESSIGWLDTRTPRIGVVAGGPLESSVADQAGDDRFLQRFALRAHTGRDDAAAMRFALEHQNPLVAGAVTGGRAYPGTRFSLVSIDDPDVLLWALKPADDGLAAAGIVARVWNLAAAPRTVSIELTDGRLVAADALTHIETPTGTRPVTGGRLTATLPSQRMATWALHAAPPRRPFPRLAEPVATDRRLATRGDALGRPAPVGPNVADGAAARRISALLSWLPGAVADRAGRAWSAAAAARCASRGVSRGGGG